MSGSVHFIVNPTSGRNAWTGELNRLLAALSGMEWAPVVHVTRSAAHAMETSAGVPDDARAIVVVGGDGTVRDVLRVRLNRPVPFVVFPTGTENLLARQLAYRPDHRVVIEALLQRRKMTVDMGTFHEHAFLSVVGVGFDAEVVRRLTARRRGHITHLDYFWPIWRTFWSFRHPRLSVRLDGETVFDGRGLAFIGNFSRYARGIRILRDADPCDGKLDLCVYPCEARSRLIAHSALTALGSHAGAMGVVYRRGERIEVESQDDCPVQADGDVAGRLPLRISVVKAAASFLLPAQARISSVAAH